MEVYCLISKLKYFIYLNIFIMTPLKYKEILSKMDREALEKELKSLKSIVGFEDEIKYKIYLVLSYLK